MGNDFITGIDSMYTPSGRPPDIRKELLQPSEMHSVLVSPMNRMTMSSTAAFTSWTLAADVTTTIPGPGTVNITSAPVMCVHVADNGSAFTLDAEAASDPGPGGPVGPVGPCDPAGPAGPDGPGSPCGPGPPCGPAGPPGPGITNETTRATTANASAAMLNILLTPPPFPGVGAGGVTAAYGEAYGGAYGAGGACPDIGPDWAGCMRAERSASGNMFRGSADGRPSPGERTPV